MGMFSVRETEDNDMRWNTDFTNVPRDGNEIIVRRRPGRKPRKYNDYVVTWSDMGWWDIRRSIPPGITCGLIKDAKAWKPVNGGR